MDHSIDPCDNFYKFACGKFKRSNNIIRPDYHSDRFVTGESRIIGDLHTTITNLDSKINFKPFKVVRKFYDTCMNTTNIELQGYQPLIKILKKLHGWPLMPTRWNKVIFSWEELVYKIRRNGYTGDYFIGLSINVDPRNSSKLALYMQDPELEFPYEQFSKGLDDPTIKAYYSYMIDIAELLGVDRNQAKNQFADVLEFEMRLSKLIHESDRVTTSLKIMRMKDIKWSWPRINWDMIVKKVLIPYVKIYDNETVIVSNPNYITAFENLINTTPSRVQKNYALWKVIQSSVPYLDSKIQKKLSTYKLSRGEKGIQNVRAVTCMLEVMKEFKLATDSLYIRNFVKRNTKAKVTEMTNYIKNELLDVIDKMRWLDKKTISDVKGQVKNVTQFIAYADELLDDNKLRNYYKDLKIDGLDYLQSSRNINTFNMKKVCQSLKQEFNYTDWTILDPWTTVNARYVKYANRIEIPAGILQSPFYEHNRPLYVNYGAIGSIIGHEFFHMFDSKDMIFSNGNIDRDSLLAQLRYLRKTTCLVNQYNNYTIEEIGEKIDGKTRVAENIADGGGIRLAYLAYQKWVSNHTPEVQLPNLSYTPNQLFWISVANTWCSVDGPNALRSVNRNSHIPNEFRVIGALSNIPEFSTDFKCPVGSKMNRQSKCTFWQQ
ncbi:neprilysin-2-like isoform X2 [Chelonus insularis]|nr:neprilysin-2-like isoform X2 [Chelonus insularis]